MRAGTMRDRITIQRWFKTDDPQFGEAGEWVPVATVWASVRPAMQATELVNGQAVQSQISHTIKLRYLDGVTPKHQVIYRDRVLDIVSVVDPDGTRSELVMACNEHPADPTTEAA